jgi:hypothetical protein
MRDLKTEAERLRVGLLGGWHTAAKVIAWADEVISSEFEPPWQVIDLALTRDRHLKALDKLLQAIPGETDQVAVMRQCLAEVRRWVGEDADRGERAAKFLYLIAGTDLLPEAVFGYEPWSLDDHFYLARSGIYGTPQEALAHLQKWLDQHVASNFL